ncbi:SusC/RagA family TonB-linked outer membrane protein [Pedobacter frigoris]|uniref:SusC/RagA family TonB-linked outer membrane protein n=1 Tax=Pedobacter frigoris TaxID=2571272 RepID=UPI00292DBC26|nr:SusC/RagA family TonB-linked outer membrane protein [Pedobacter frigoris]
MRLTTVLFLACLMQVSASTLAQRVTMSKSNATLRTIFKDLKAQTGYNFLYTERQLNNAVPVNLNLKNVEITEALKLIFEQQPFDYKVEDKTVMITERPVTKQQIITGRVTDSLYNLPIIGVNVRIKGKPSTASTATATNAEGTFTIRADIGDVLVFTYIGFKVKEVTVRSATMNVRLSENVNNMQDVVITGMMRREKSSFSGASATFSGEQLKQVGNQNLIQSIRTLDPSFVQLENNLAGSNPNVAPTIQLRGETSINSAGLRDEFANDPNQPLFILDGFETNLRTIVDLDMNIIASVTILKDASSTAIYGSRASNGVIVVETKKPVPGKVALSYTSDLNFQLADLSGYNMMNAREKLQFERLSGVYTIDPRLGQTVLAQQVQDSIYNSRLKEVERGVNTYWLGQPLQTGFSQRHSISARGGSESVIFDIGANYKATSGLMKGNSRDDYGANATIAYRVGKLNILNRTSIQGFTSNESPYGSFSTWVNTNPYYRLASADRPFLETVSVPRSSFGDDLIFLQGDSLRVENPLYNAKLNSFNKTSSFQLLNNLQITYDFSNALKLQINGQLNKTDGETSNYVSPLNTRFLNITDPLLRGRLNNRKTRGLNYDLNGMITYAKLFAEKHSLTSSLRAQMRQLQNVASGFNVVGFPNASNGNPSFGYGFETGTTPSAVTSITRTSSITGVLSYSYDRRYNLDFNLNLDGSTAFGKNNLYDTYYSIGGAWNVSNEAFMKGIEWISMLRLRASTGLTGNQNFNAVSQSVYNYYTNVNGSGQGIYLSALGAPNLQWQSTQSTNIGLDANFMEKRLTLVLDAYQKTTDPLVVAVTLPSSTGLTDYPFNAGALNEKGVEATIGYSPIYRPQEQILWTLRLTGAMSKQRYSRFDDKLNSLNNELSESNSLVRYRDGFSSTAMWAVPSLGIDPASGKEIFLKRSGEQTFEYDAADEVVVGDARPNAEGVLSSSVTYKGFNFSVAARYIFSRDMFNRALYDKVENISITQARFNQDKRALYDRWQQTGDVARFKSIGITEYTPMSSRFVQKENVISIESINIGYDFRNKAWLNKAALSSLRVNAFTNDLFFISNIRRERGTDFPFAKSVSLSLTATFK